MKHNFLCREYYLSLPDYIHLKVRQHEKPNNLENIENGKENKMSILNLIDNQGAIQNSNSQVKYLWHLSKIG